MISPNNDLLQNGYAKAYRRLPSTQNRGQLLKPRKVMRFPIVVGFLCAALLLVAVGNFFVSSADTSISPEASGSGNVVVIADFNNNLPVDPGASAFMSRVVSTAKNQDAAAIVIDMNTAGGVISDMRSIISSIEDANQSGIPTYTYIERNGLGESAGSYIALATNSILMGPGSKIGSCSPTVVYGTALEQNHTKAAMLSLLTGLAQDWGRNVTAAYNMVESNQAFSEKKAVVFNVVDGEATSLSNALSQWGLSGLHRTYLGEDFSEQLTSTLSNAIIDGVLFLLGVVAVVLYVFHPTNLLVILGVIAIVAGLVGADIIGASLLGIVILVMAAALIAAELKSGHGFAVMVGVILGAVGSYFLMSGLQYSPSPINLVAEIEFGLIVVFGVIAGLYVRWVIGPVRRRSKITGPKSIIGKMGIATTELKPKGEVKVSGVTWRAESLSGDIEKGEAIRVKSLNGLVATVEKDPEQKSTSAK